MKEDRSHHSGSQSKAWPKKVMAAFKHSCNHDWIAKMINMIEFLNNDIYVTRREVKMLDYGRGAS